MRILHLCLANFYIDGYGYQENILPKVNKSHGHEVLIIASTETYIDKKTLGYVKPGKYLSEHGIPIIRLPYVSLFLPFFTRKMRIYKGLYKAIEDFSPDIVFSHDLSFLSVHSVIRYIKGHSRVAFYADSHTAFYNSGKNWLSLHILHKIIYRNAIRPAVRLLKKYFYIGFGEHDFARQIYKIPEELMEFYPLGGIVFDDISYYEKRNRLRTELGLLENEPLFVHSGKMNKDKRVIELIQGFKNRCVKAGKLVIIGSLEEDIAEKFQELVKNDSTIMYLGWKRAEELQDYLCAADLYCQPGSVSSTMQTSVCCRCPVMVNKDALYHFCDEFDNLIWVDTVDEITEAFDNILNGTIDLNAMSIRSKACADRFFNYESLASRIEQ